MSGFRRHVGVVLVAMLVMGAGGQAIAAKPRPEAAGTRATKVIKMKDDLFKPKNVKVAKGTTIKWVNKGQSAHTTTGKGWDKTLSPGQSFSRKFKKAGTFKYVCTFHDGMIGKIVVS